mgnify:CR=1 FL=1
MTTFIITEDDGAHSNEIESFSTYQDAKDCLNNIITTKDWEDGDDYDYEVIKVNDDEDIYEPMDCYNTIVGFRD